MTRPTRHRRACRRPESRDVQALPRRAGGGAFHRPSSHAVPTSGPARVRPAARPRAHGPASTSRGRGVDWATLFLRPKSEPRWLCEPLLEAGRLIALYSPAKTGKSLLALEIAAALAAGRPVLGNGEQPPVTVLYVDMENSEDDILERLRDLGFGPQDLDNLHYLSFPALGHLDTERGGQALLAQARHYGA